MMPALLLFLTFFRIGLVAVGGGYAMIPLMQDALVAREWMTAETFLDILAVSEMTPGPIAVNAATFAGYRVAGMGGAAAATIGVCLPGFLLMLLAAAAVMRFREHRMYRMIMRLVHPVVCGLLLAAAWSMAVAILRSSVPPGPLPQGLPDIRAGLIFLLVFALAGRRGIHPLALIGGAAAAGVWLYR